MTGRKLPLILLAALLAACGSSGETGDGSTADGVARANADIRAAEAATRAPVTVNRSVAELAGNSGKDERDKPTPKKAVAAPREAVAEAPAEPVATPPAAAPAPSEPADTAAR
ncbi:hypothetical protein FJQ54_14930 [Sandaracinobacter neustonicus]|uniref:Uncharacterized protein n=1 Tax=Sandaracinobacter neustonicus TaxID=1715348 RepID=A0A501XEZ6_9SPHN|nr:hypothetical protein [Sandaracinobacter neustonicus]TPE59086.1 hypothetical protein FJQ54_14930 [Sandaracinobacter neustonicus]